MKKTISELNRILKDYEPLLQQLDEQTIGIKPDPDKWSKKEILGHLADSAQANLRRFIVAQYEDQPKIVYKQDFWVAVNGYAQVSKKDLIDLWKLLNQQICRVLESTRESYASKLCKTDDPEPHTISWLAEDYIKHLLHHLHQILDLEPVAYL